MSQDEAKTGCTVTVECKAKSVVQKRSDARPEKEPAWKLVLVLTLVCAGAAAALAGVHQLTAEPIKQARFRFKQASVIQVLPECDNEPGQDTVEVDVAGVGETTVYRCRKNGEVIAVAFSIDTEKNANPPYSGPIEVLVGVTREGRIVASKETRKVGVAILQHTETPGLGAQITGDEFLSTFHDNAFTGRNLTEDGKSCSEDGSCKKWAVRKDDPAGFVDVISGATVTTRAMTEIVQRALHIFNQNKQEMLGTGESETLQTGEAGAMR